MTRFIATLSVPNTADGVWYYFELEMCYVAVILIALSFISTELSVIWIRSYFEKSTCNEEELRCKTSLCTKPILVQLVVCDEVMGKLVACKILL